MTAVIVLSVCCSDPVLDIDPRDPPLLIDAFPRWSPDGSRIVYYHHGIVGMRGGRTISDLDSLGLWVVGSDGSDPHLLIQGNVIYADWAPSSESLVFVYGAQIYRIALTDSTVDSLSIAQLTDSGVNFFPDWSPDGQWIAYDSNAATGGLSEIWVMRPDGANKRRFDHGATGEWRSPSWSPTLSICHTRAGSSGQPEIFTMDFDGGNAVQVTHNDRDDRSPRYSPDGTKLVFESIASAEDIAISLVNADGTNASRLTTGRDPCWSPDGVWIAFIRPSSNLMQNGTVWKIHPDGTGLTQITFGPE